MPCTPTQSRDMQKCHMESKQAVVTFSGFIKYSWKQAHGDTKLIIMNPPASWHVLALPSGSAASPFVCQMPVSPACLVAFRSWLLLGAKAKQGAAM